MRSLMKKKKQNYVRILLAIRNQCSVTPDLEL